MIREHVVAIRAAALAQVAVCDALLSAIDEAPGPLACAHRNRQNIGTMTSPNVAFCLDCKQTFTPEAIVNGGG